MRVESSYKVKTILQKLPIYYKYVRVYEMSLDIIWHNLLLVFWFVIKTLLHCFDSSVPRSNVLVLIALQWGVALRWGREDIHE